MLVEQVVTIGTSVIVTITTTVVGLIVTNYIKEKRTNDKMKDAEFELAKIQLEALIKTMLFINKDADFEKIYDKFYRESINSRIDLQELLKQKL